MFKFVFSVILVGAICETSVFSVPVDSGPSFPHSLEVVGKAVLDIFKTAGDFATNVTTIVKSHAKLELDKIVSVFMLRVEIMMVASGSIRKVSSLKHSSPAELKEYQVVATSVEEVVEQLNKMELANQIIGRTIREVVNRTIAGHVTASKGARSLYAKLDEKFQAEIGVQELYKKLREKNERRIPLPSEDEPVEIGVEPSAKFLKVLLNFVFVNFIDYRLSIPRDDFIMARSMVELAKDPKKFAEIQGIYEETLEEVSKSLDLNALKDQNKSAYIVESLFRKLKEKFEKHPSINEELRTMQKDVSGRSDWNRSIWDLPF